MRPLATAAGVLFLLVLLVLAIAIQTHVASGRVSARLLALEDRQAEQAEAVTARLASAVADLSTLIAHLDTEHHRRYVSLRRDLALLYDDQTHEQLRALSSSQHQHYQELQEEIDFLTDQGSLLAMSFGQTQQNQRVQLTRLDEDIVGLMERLEQAHESLKTDLERSRQATSTEMTEAQTRLQESLREVDRRIIDVSLEQERLTQMLEEWDPVVLAPSVPSPVDAGLATLPPSPDDDLPVLAAMKDATELYHAGRYAQARDGFAHILELQPENDRARLYYAASLYYENPGASANYVAIERDLHEATRSVGANPDALRVLGLLALEQAQWVQGLSYYRQVIAIQPESVGDLKIAGRLCLYQKDYTMAADYLDRVIVLDDSDPESWYFAARAHAGLGRYQQALTRYERTLQIDPSFTSARQQIGLTYCALGRHEEALPHLKAVPRSTSALVALGDCHDHLGQAPQARATWLEAIDGTRENTERDRALVADLYVRLARSSWESADYVSAIQHCEAGLERRFDPVLFVYQGMSYIGLGQVDRGRRLLAEVAESHPGTEAGRMAGRALATARGGV